MDIIDIFPANPIPAVSSATSVALGNFDGLHSGHQKVIEKAVKLASQKKIPSAVMTFYPHPKEVLGKVDEPSYLTPLPDKMRLIERLQVDQVLLIHFDLNFSEISPEQFIRQYIIGLNIQDVVTGFDFRFGKYGAGDVELLKKWSQINQDFEVHVVSSFNDQQGKVSSSRVRQALAEGDIQKVTALLQRAYECCGKVVHGDKKGRLIGFPTANLAFCQPYVLPREGVYAVQVLWKGQKFKGVLNLGRKPTFNKENPAQIAQAEVHILGFEGNLYGEMLGIRFLAFIRPEKAFPAVEDLIRQIKKDIADAEPVFAQAGAC